MTPHDAIRAKIRSADTLRQQIAIWRFRGHRMVFTNGCFDLIHFGHLKYLMDAKACGDKLIVGINSDASVSRLKGRNRPIKDQNSRVLLLASLAFVDTVVIFEEDTPERLIREVTPDVLVKGGDYSPDQVVGAEWVTSHGGEVRILPFVEGYSTTALEKKILEQAD